MARVIPQGRGGRATGHFDCRQDLIRNVWAMHRLQIVSNLTTIARACGTGVGAVATIIATGEGGEDYLATGCRLGA
ncbi:MAG: hypothetical protein QOJ91_836 [Sphingomonadales bacterium]|jgi:hypothetical protein|nr:hypothetical protein [Sphingomonadales bacterium]